MRKYLLLLVFYFISFFCFSQINPSNISGLVLWLRADSNVVLHGDTISQWGDCSGNGNNAIQTTPLSQPLYITNSINGKPVISFNGLNQFLVGPTISNINTSSITIFVVANGASGSGYSSGFFDINSYPNFIFGRGYLTGGTLMLDNNNASFGASLNSAAGTLPNSGFGYSLLECTKNYGNISNIYINETIVGSSTDVTQNGTFTNGNYDIGMGNNASFINYYSGNIAEILVYNQALSTIDRKAVEKYFRNKYTPLVNLGSDIYIPYGFCDTVIRAGKNFSSYLWSPSSATSDSIIVNKTGHYSVSVTDIFGDTTVDSIYVQYPPPIFLNDTFFCQYDSVLLAPYDTGSYTYLWSNNAATPAIYAKSPGKYWLVVTDTNHCTTDTIKVNITEDTYPSLVSLGADTTKFCAGNSISLTSGAAQTVSYLWSNSATTSSIVINTPGDYSITATDAGGCKGRDTTYVKITGIAPVIGFFNSKGCSNDSISFTDTSTVTSPATIESWNWNFGDGSISTHQNPNHKYLPGTYLVKDSVVSSTGCYNIKTKTIHIPASPMAAFAVDTACAGHYYTFVDSSISNEGNIISWDWDFGDGSHSHSKDTVHKYSIAANYNVTLSIQTDSGCSGTDMHTIPVVGSAPKPVGFTLYLPSDSFVTNSHIINFAWNIAINAATYTLEYSPDPLFASGVIDSSNIHSTTIQLFISTPKNYYWRVIAFGICRDSIISNMYNFSIFDNNSISGMQLWLKADTALALLNDSLVTQWKDCSGNGNNATSSAQPTKRDSIKYLNYKPIINFNGINQFFEGTTISNINTSSITIFVVANGASGSGYSSGFFDINSYPNFIFGRGYLTGGTLLLDNNNASLGASLNSTAGTLPNSGFGYSLLECTKNYGVISNIYLDGTNVGSSIDVTQNGTFTNGNYDIGMGNNASFINYYNGNIAEILVYNQALNTINRKTVEKYLHYKYAPPVNLGPDIWSTNFCDTTLDASPRFVNYLWNTGETTSSIHVDTSGKYWVSVTDIFGFTSSDTVLVHKPFITAHDTLACFGSSVTLHAGLGAPYTFHWYPGNFTTEAISVTAPDTVNLIVYGPDSCFVMRQVVVRADSFKLIASLGGADTSMCQGDLIGLVSGSSTAQYYQWNDGTINSMDSILWTAGTHPVYLTVTDINGCQAIDSIKVKVIGVKPSAAFTSDSVCQGTLTQLVGDTICNCGGAVIDNFQWSFGDDSTGSGQKPSHLYQKYGIFPVTMTVKTTAGCIASVTEPTCVFSNPVANFIPLIGCEGVPLHFSDKSTNAFGNLSSWYWNFGDTGSGVLNTSTFENPSHTYHTVSTTDVVELIVTTQFGCKDTADKTVTIREAPDVGFRYTSVCEGNPVYFTDTSTTPITNQIINWDWHFSPTDSSMIQNPVYLFNNGGTYRVWLTVKAINGCSVTDTENVVVHAIPDANFVVSEACMDSPYAFTDSSTVLAPDSIVQWIWNFGIPGNSTLKNPVVTFPDSVNYTISLFVQSNAGCNSSITQDIHVNPSPVAAFQPDYYYGVSPFTVSFTNSSQGASYYSWNFGNGDTSNLIDPSCTYTYNDSFRVQLTVYNQYGCASTDSHVLMVIPTIADIAVTAVDTNIQGNYVALSADIANYGSQRIYSMYITAEPQGGTSFTETWTDLINPLQPGGTMTYHFNGKYALSEMQGADYICVGAQIVNEDPDNNPSNNVQCIPFKDAFIAYDPYPSPINNQLLHIDFILPAPDNVGITMYGLKGDLIAKIYSGAAAKGLNMLTINVSSLSLGIYTYRIIYRDEQRILRFIKY